MIPFGACYLVSCSILIKPNYPLFYNFLMFCVFLGISDKYPQDSYSFSVSHNNKFINSPIIAKTKTYKKLPLSSASGAKNCRFSVVMFCLETFS